MDATLGEAEARAYLNAKFAQIRQAVADRDWDAATAVVAQMRADGFADAADEVFDGLMEAKAAGDHPAAGEEPT